MVVKRFKHQEAHLRGIDLNTADRDPSCVTCHPITQFHSLTLMEYDTLKWIAKYCEVDINRISRKTLESLNCIPEYKNSEKFKRVNDKFSPEDIHCLYYFYLASPVNTAV